MLEPLATTRGRRGQRLPVAAVLERRQIAVRERAERVRAARSQHERGRCAGGLRRARRHIVRDHRRHRRLGQHNVRVRSAETERVDADGQGGIAGFERHIAIDDTQAPAVEIDGRIGNGEMQRARHRAMLEAQHGLQQACHPGCRLEVADVGLHRADEQRAVRRACARHDVDQRARLDRIADRRAGAMRLQVGERLRIDARARVDATQQRRLRRRARHADAARRVADRIHAGAGDHRMDRVAVGDRAVKRLEQHERTAFRANVAVAGRIERAAAAARREHRSLGEADEAERVQQQVDAAGERRFRFAGLQRLDSLMKCDER